MKNFLKLNKYHISSIFFIFLLFLIYNKTLVLNLSTALSDWYDYPLMVYIIQENISHLSTLDFTNFGNFSIYYPTPNGMYFTDLLLPQSIIALIIFPFVQDFLTTHNLVFIIVGLLNIISLQYFWSKVFKDKKVSSLLTLLFTFSPYVLSMYAHYQMISYWFFFFSLGLLIEAKNSKHFLFAGILSGMQFLAAVYLGIYSLTVAGIFFVWKVIETINFQELQKFQFTKILKNLVKSRNVRSALKNSVVFLAGFTLIAGYFIYQFAHTKNIYSIVRPADDYVNHSMQITDFLFNPLPSIWVEGFYNNINIYNHRLGGETFGTGFVVLILFFYGLKQFKKTKLNKTEKSLLGFLILLLIWGFFAMMGPRLSINGNYLAIPLPYIFPLKLTPIFDALRVVSRWFFVFQIGIFYFIGIALSSIFSKNKPSKAFIIIILIALIYAVEIIPIKQRTSINSYRSYSYDTLIESCANNDVLIEYPFAPQQPNTHILITLEYWTKMLLNNMLYKCQLINGYSGFQPKHIDDYIHYFRIAIENSNNDDLQQLLDQKNVSYIKINKKYMLESSIITVSKSLESDNFDILIDDFDFLVVRVK